jgi:hypothetical protein
MANSASRSTSAKQLKLLNLSRSDNGFLKRERIGAPVPTTAWHFMLDGSIAIYSLTLLIMSL